MTARILALYDRSPLGDLAVESAFQFARGHDAAALVVLAVPEVSGDAGQREVLHDDLLIFVRLGQRQCALFGAHILQIADQSPVKG